MIENIELPHPLLLVETKRTLNRTSPGYLTLKVIKSAEENKYKEGDTIITEAKFLTDFIIDEEPFENIYLLNETMAKGKINA